MWIPFSKKTTSRWGLILVEVDRKSRWQTAGVGMAVVGRYQEGAASKRMLNPRISKEIWEDKKQVHKRILVVMKSECKGHLSFAPLPYMTIDTWFVFFDRLFIVFIYQETNWWITKPQKKPLKFKGNIYEFSHPWMWISSTVTGPDSLLTLRSPGVQGNDVEGTEKCPKLWICCRHL